MHLTEIILKDGRRFEGIIDKQRLDPDVFDHSYIKLNENLFYIKDITSATTKEDRISSTEISDVDEIESMRELWEEYKKGRAHGIPLVEEEHKLSPGH